MVYSACPKSKSSVMETKQKMVWISDRSVLDVLYSKIQLQTGSKPVPNWFGVVLWNTEPVIFRPYQTICSVWALYMVPNRKSEI